MTPDVSRSRKTPNGQPVSIIPSWNLSCHNVLFLRYLKKKIVTVDDVKMELPVKFLKFTSAYVDTRSLAPTKSDLVALRDKESTCLLV